MRFDVKALTLSNPPPNDDLTLALNRKGLTIEGWRDGLHPTLAGRTLALLPYERARSLAIAPDAKRFFLGSNFAVIVRRCWNTEMALGERGRGLGGQL